MKLLDSSSISHFPHTDYSSSHYLDSNIFIKDSVTRCSYGSELSLALFSFLFFNFLFSVIIRLNLPCFLSGFICICSFVSINVLLSFVCFLSLITSFRLFYLEVMSTKFTFIIEFKSIGVATLKFSKNN